MLVVSFFPVSFFLKGYSCNLKQIRYNEIKGIGKPIAMNDRREIMDMTMLQEQAIDLIKKLPDDKIYHVINILEEIERLFPMKDETGLEKSQKAYQELQQYRKSSSIERNYKAELAEALEEKYEYRMRRCV